MYFSSCGLPFSSGGYKRVEVVVQHSGWAITDASSDLDLTGFISINKVDLSVLAFEKS